MNGKFFNEKTSHFLALWIWVYNARIVLLKLEETNLKNYKAFVLGGLYGSIFRDLKGYRQRNS